MIDFFRALFDPDLVFLRNALLLGLIGSIPLGAVGTFVVARRISYLAAAIAHSVLGGIGAALYAREVWGFAWLHPMLGALIAALIAASVIAWVSLRSQQREDAVIGAIWVTGMAIGLLFISRTPGYLDPMAYLFGDILLVTSADLWIAGVVGTLILVILLLWHRQIVAVCFDSEFAAIRGVHADRMYLLLLLLTALTVVTLVSLVGIVLVIALLTLPPAIASLRARSLGQMLLCSIALTASFVFLGLGFSYTLNFPTGPTIILLAALVYLLGNTVKRVFSK
ncbi:metal ABC transporter permease [Coraliomargarita sp. SDUM461004]|uniref:Metal ABC transporter permease n=1 Tax=Thalassobacterium sedimentorum TaxID=3041258 RepID=A0ABU1ADW7_9BACT|nr:metal ABC transporter permease [Coraliomargarita sp. SDUM461004]MDQ8192794.1 metal ABC transporter permease [Coraliomargarita sp. SDUM461004]